MPNTAGIPDEATGDIELPPPINLSSQVMIPYGLYLIDDGQTQFLWVGREVVPQLVLDVFGVPDRTQLKVGKTTLPVLDNDFNERVRTVVEKSRDHRSKGVGSIIVPSVYVVREDGEPGMKLWAQSMLVEDRADQGVSLSQWLGMLREKVGKSLSLFMPESLLIYPQMIDERRRRFLELFFMIIDIALSRIIFLMDLLGRFLACTRMTYVWCNNLKIRLSIIYVHQDRYFGLHIQKHVIIIEFRARYRGHFLAVTKVGMHVAISLIIQRFRFGSFHSMALQARQIKD